MSRLLATLFGLVLLCAGALAQEPAKEPSPDRVAALEQTIKGLQDELVSARAEAEKVKAQAKQQALTPGEQSARIRGALTEAFVASLKSEAYQACRDAKGTAFELTIQGGQAVATCSFRIGRP